MFRSRYVDTDYGQQRRMIRRSISFIFIFQILLVLLMIFCFVVAAAFIWKGSKYVGKHGVKATTERLWRGENK